MAEHVRIDEGLKRGPRPTRLDPLDHRRTDNQSKLPDNLDLESIIASIASGNLMSQIARELGVTPQALSARLLKHPEYKAAREACHEARLDEAEEWSEEAADALEIARAREVWRARSWRASVEYPQRWGPKQEVTHVGSPSLTINVAQIAAPQLVPQLPEPIDDATQQDNKPEK